MIGGIFIFLFYLLLVLLGSRYRKSEPPVSTVTSSPPYVEETDVVYNGATEKIALNEIEAILEKHYPYYVALQSELKEKFLKRTHNFISDKIFIIKSNEGYKEMPVLVSAAAIQLSFGLKDYLLPFYRYIRIYPQEYFGDELFKVLEGNVQNNIITVAWNYFLKGYEDLADGSNVGLHEMSHAVYFQKTVIDPDSSRIFCRNYDHVLTACKEAHQAEISGQKNLYSAYADTDLQEFWAEGVEIFFEKPNELSTQYPAVYQAMKILLNQDPLNKTAPILQEKASLSKKFEKIFKLSKTYSA